MKKVSATITIMSSPEAVMTAFTDIDKLRHWWGVDRSLISKHVGGLYCLAWHVNDHGIGFITSGTISEYDPGSHLVITNIVYMNPERPFLGPMTLSIRVVQSGHATQVHLIQSGYQDGDDWDWYYNAVQQAWPAVLQKLKEYLEA